MVWITSTECGMMLKQARMNIFLLMFIGLKFLVEILHVGRCWSALLSIFVSRLCRCIPPWVAMNVTISWIKECVTLQISPYCNTCKYFKYLYCVIWRNVGYLGASGAWGALRGRGASEFSNVLCFSMENGTTEHLTCTRCRNVQICCYLQWNWMGAEPPHHGKNKTCSNCPGC